MPPAAAAFDRLVDRLRPEILAYLARLLGDPHDAEDACQETWLRAYRAWARLRPESNERAWVYKIASRVAFSALKRRRREQARRADDVDWETLPAAGVDPAGSRRDLLRQVMPAVEDLPPRQRAALMQRLFQELSYAEIAEALGGSPEAARANVYQALRKLRRQLGGANE